MESSKSHDQRKHVRLPGRGSEAGDFTGGNASLPALAVVSDISEGGVGLVFDWPGGTGFPLESEDGLAFRLNVEGTDQMFEVMSLVRHIVTAGGRRAVKVGVEFTGMGGAEREVLKKAMVDLAVTSLRSWQQGKPPAKPSRPAGLPAAGTKRRKLYLGEILVKQGALPEDRLQKFLSEEFTGEHKLGEELASKGLVDDRAIARALAEQMKVAFVDLERDPPNRKLLADLPREIFCDNNCLPLREEEGAVLVAMSAPPELETYEKIRDAVGKRLRIAMVASGQLASWLKRAYNVEGVASPANIRFNIRLHAEYRFLTADWKGAIDERAAVGLTTEVSHRGMTIAGPLPQGITPERIREEELRMAVRVSCPDLEAPLAMGCTPTLVKPSDYRDEHIIECRIDKFPESGEQAWSRLCLVRGTVRFHPGVVGK
ncbi:MAG: GspE/PulE/PilB domain-containing protein [Planctomycetota bacterium]|jgi:hypothetical protein